MPVIGPVADDWQDPTFAILTNKTSHTTTTTWKIPLSFLALVPQAA